MHSLKDFSALVFYGKKADQLLQGQLSADVMALATDQACLTCVCNHKGRMLANGIIAKENSDRFILFAAHPCIDAVEDAMKRFLPFFAVTLQRPQAVYAYAGDSSPPQGVFVPKWPGKLGCGIIEGAASGAAMETQWLAGWWQQGVVFLRRPEQVAAYIPSDLCWDRFAASFDKGCYTGQEIIARVHYRGNPKQQCSFGRVESEPTDTQLIDSTGKKAGEIIDSLRMSHKDNTWLIVATVAKNLLADIRMSGNVPVHWWQPDYPEQIL